MEWRIRKRLGKPQRNVHTARRNHSAQRPGKPLHLPLPDSDSGVFLRGSGALSSTSGAGPLDPARCAPGHGSKTSPELRAAVTPRTQADKPVGDGIAFHVTVAGNTVTVVLNEKTVIAGATIPDLPARGVIVLQHHGGKQGGEWNSPPSLVQFRNIYIKPLAN